MLSIVGPVVRVRPLLQVMRSELRVIKAVRLEHDNLVLITLIIHFMSVFCVICDSAL